VRRYSTVGHRTPLSLYVEGDMTMPLTPGRYGTVDGTSTVKTITCRVRVHDFLSCNTELANKYTVVSLTFVLD